MSACIWIVAGTQKWPILELNYSFLYISSRHSFSCIFIILKSPQSLTGGAVCLDSVVKEDARQPGCDWQHLTEQGYLNLQYPILFIIFWSLEGSRNKLWAQHWHIINFCGKHWAVAYLKIQVATEERDRSFRDLHLGSWWVFTFF